MKREKFQIERFIKYFIKGRNLEESETQQASLPLQSSSTYTVSVSVAGS